MDESRPNALTPLALPGGAHIYTRPGLSVTVDLDAEGYDDPDVACVVVEDHARWMVYGVVAREDEQGRARLISLAISTIDDDESPLGRYLDTRPERSREWLARTAVECWRRSTSVRAPLDDDELLAYVAQTVQRCEREGVAASDVLQQALSISSRSVTRLLGRAVAAGLLPPRRRGRPRKSTPEETPDD